MTSLTQHARFAGDLVSYAAAADMDRASATTEIIPTTKTSQTMVRSDPRRIGA